MNKLPYLLLTFCLVLILSACSRLTADNYDELKMGMSKPEVEEIIGEADSCEENLGTLSCIWGREDGRYIKVSFAGERAVFFDQNGLG